MVHLRVSIFAFVLLLMVIDSTNTNHTPSTRKPVDPDELIKFCIDEFMVNPSTCQAEAMEVEPMCPIEKIKLTAKWGRYSVQALSEELSSFCRCVDVFYQCALKQMCTICGSGLITKRLRKYTLSHPYYSTIHRASLKACPNLGYEKLCSELSSLVMATVAIGGLAAIVILCGLFVYCWLGKTPKKATSYRIIMAPPVPCDMMPTSGISYGGASSNYSSTASQSIIQINPAFSASPTKRRLGLAKKLAATKSSSLGGSSTSASSSLSSTASSQSAARVASSTSFQASSLSSASKSRRNR